MNMARRVSLISIASVLVLGALLLPLLSACASAPAGVVVVTCKGKQFNPANVTISPGTTVRWVNDDDTAHTTTSDNFVAAGSTGETNTPTEWNSDPLNPGQSFERKFTTAGKSDYSCLVHPYMHGSVTVK